MSATERYSPGPLCVPLLGLVAAMALAGCTQAPVTAGSDAALMREALDGTGTQRAAMPPEPVDPARPTASAPAARQIITGNQRFVRPTAAQPRAAAGEAGELMFNFTDQPIEAVINTVLGDVLHADYSISPDVKGSVSFSTGRPVTKAQALSILETLLGWTNNAMIRQGGRYVILPAAQAVAGKLVPEMPVVQPAAGLSARLYPLRYIGAGEMQKLLKPFARDNAFLLVDPARNVLSLAGTPEELANYQDTIDTFDVDWLRGMSIGVYGLQHASVGELMPQLQKLFGPDSGLPLGAMLKFMPNERTNSIVAISAQPAYLQEVGEWIKTIDEGGGNEPQLYVYDVRNLKAAELARYLRQIYGTAAIREEAAAKTAPGLRTTTLASLNGTGASAAGVGGLASSAATTTARSDDADTDADDSAEEQGSSGTESDASAGEGSAKTLEESVRITANKGTNQLLVRTRPAQWKEIETAIQRLDNRPLQVQIETRILEVKLSGELDLGVQWYLGKLAGNSSSTTVANTSGSQGALGSGGAGLGSTDSLFYSFVSNNLQVALHALETSGRTQVLSAPSLVVMNNQQAQIQVGDNIPITQTTVNTSSSSTTLSSVEYVQTGVILDVTPRINPGGLVYLDVQQQVSNADTSSVTTSQPNPSISTRSVSTQVAVQSGQTVLLGGLIKQDNAETTSSVPGLGKVPGLRWLFGNTAKSKARTELIVLMTPRVVASTDDARRATDEYRQRMQLLRAAYSETHSQSGIE